MTGWQDYPQGKRRYLEVDLGFPVTQERHVASTTVKFGAEQSTINSSAPNSTLIRQCSVDPRNLNFTKFLE